MTTLAETIRQRLAELHILNEVGRLTSLRVKAAKASGRGPGPEGNTAKLLMSRITRLSRDLGLEILGPHGMLMGPETPGGGVAGNPRPEPADPGCGARHAHPTPPVWVWHFGHR